MAQILSNGLIQFSDGQILYSDTPISGQHFMELQELLPQINPIIGRSAMVGFPFVSGGGGGAGTPGARGADGSPGPQGVTGIAGGGTGPQGATGPQGVTGPSMGIQGPTGVQGPQGPTGVQGLTGAGIQGQTGTQGPTGPQGQTGSQGTTGAGVQGVTGPQGATGAGGGGATGVQGSTGVQGVQGATGAGTQGATGIQGATGPGGGAGTKAATDFLFFFSGTLSTVQNNLIPIEVQTVPVTTNRLDVYLQQASQGQDVKVSFFSGVTLLGTVTVTAGTTSGTLAIGPTVIPALTQVTAQIIQVGTTTIGQTASMYVRSM